MMVGSQIGRNGCWIAKLMREGNGIRGVFGAALEEMSASFCSGLKRDLAQKVGERGVWE
jgi:hypothetical protein